MIIGALSVNIRKDANNGDNMPIISEKQMYEEIKKSKYEKFINWYNPLPILIGSIIGTFIVVSIFLYTGYYSSLFKAFMSFIATVFVINIVFFAIYRLFWYFVNKYIDIKYFR